MPAPLTIALFAGKCLPVTARTLEERPLGGTETAIIRVAAALHERGHEVTVYTTAREIPESLPRYRHISTIRESGPVDAFIAVKDWWPIFLPIRAQLRLFWTGDSFDQYVNFGLGDKRVAGTLDALLAVSGWHGRSLAEVSGFPVDKVVVVGNGVYLPWFEGGEPRHRKRLIYSSAPYRGLALVPGLFTRVRETHPDAELHVFSGLSIYDTDKPFTGPEQQQFEEIARALRALPGCTVHGNVRQAELAREFMRSAVLFYPNIFLETCCITALEAQAGGCPVITSAAGALPEIVGPAGVLIPGRPGSPEYLDAFVEATNRLLTGDELFNRLASTARQRAQSFGWGGVAERFEQALNMLLARKAEAAAMKSAVMKPKPFSQSPTGGPR